ncbi:uncharacterized protein LOC144037139 isoform X2 [Vanacampus margaritifer]
MNKEGNRCVKSASRSQKPSMMSQQGTVQRRKKESTSKDSHSGGQPKGASAGQRGSGKEAKTTEKLPQSAVIECTRRPGAQRKLSDASNTSEDLSKDSGCLSGKPSSSDSSSEISDCTWEGNKRDSPISDNELSWTDARAYEGPNRGGKDDGKERVKEAHTACHPPLDAVGGALTLVHSSGAFMDLIMAETTDDLVREVEDLRSENEYLRDEVEELRCEMLEMRDMFQEEETRQLQDLRQQLEQANKTCRILQYRLRKAERRSIRVAQTGQVDGELVRTLEHDIKVAKSVSLRLYNELEVVQKKNSQLDWENEMLREKTQELEVAKHVLQTELEKARESFLKKRSARSTASKTERRLSQQIEHDDGDLKCQLHFAKEELALMCKKLTKMVSESEVMHEQLAGYHSAYGDLDASRSPEGKQKSAHAREAEVKVHLKLVEEEAMLLSRRIVELEVENRGLRAEMNDLKERDGGGGAEEEGSRNVRDERLAPSTLRKNRKDRGQSLKTESALHDEKAAEGTEGQLPSCHATREGPVGGEWDPSESVSNKSPDSSLKGMTVTDYATLAALRDHSCILNSAIQLMKTPPKNGHCSSSSGALSPPTDGKTQSLFLPGPLNEALELLQAMLQAFIMRMDVLLSGKNSPHQEAHVWGSYLLSSLSGEYVDQDTVSQSFIESARKQECVQVLHIDANERAQQTSGGLSSKWDLRMQLSVQILWILHQWCQASVQEAKEVKDKRMIMLRGLLQSIGAELQEETPDGEAFGVRSTASECAVSGDVTDEGRPDANRVCSSTRQKLNRQLSPHAYKRKNWCYVSQQAALLDQEQPVKTWDHLIMPLSFPDLDFEQMFMERSHTAPEKSALRIYCSPPSKRRVQLAQLKQSPESDRESVDTQSPWWTPPTSFSTLCGGSSANLSDDMKEMAAGWRQASHGGSQVSRRRLASRGVDVACCGTQTHMRPPMVSIGLQTEGPGSVTVKNSPSRAVNSSLGSNRSRSVSTSLDRLTTRTERSRLTASSPKLYRSQSASGASSNLSSSSTANTRDRTLWNHQSHSGQMSRRSAPGQNLSPLLSEPQGQNLKPPNKSAGGLVTEFLRRVSGRAERPGSAQKMKSNLERIPARASASSLPRNDSVNRIVNHRFMRQREEVSRDQREEKRRSGSNGTTYNLRSPMAEQDGNYDCSSSSTLTFCFARPFRSTHRQTANQSKVARCQTAE